MSKKLLYCFLCLSFLLACKRDAQYFMENINIKELPIFCSSINENKLIPKDEIKNKVLILNSKEDVIENISESFLHEYPNYLDIDFEKYTLLVRTSYVDYHVINRKVSLIKETCCNYYHLQIRYEVGEILPENNYSVERIAIISEKINKDTEIKVEASISQV